MVPHSKLSLLYSLVAVLLVAGCAASTAPSSSRPLSLVSRQSFDEPILPPVTTIPSVFIVPKDTTVAWTDPESTPLYYNIYYGLSSRDYDTQIPAGTNVQSVLTNLVGGRTYYFAVTAQNDFGTESDFSNEAVYTVPLDIDMVFYFNDPVTNAVIQSSSDLSTWKDCFTTQTNGMFRVSVNLLEPITFYRALGVSP